MPNVARGGANLLTAEAGFEAADLPGLRKAAILVMALGEELSTVLFKSLSDANVQKVTDEISNLGDVPAALLKQVLMEFYGLLETQQYMIRGGPEYALKLLTEAFGPQKAEELLAQVRNMRERSTWPCCRRWSPGSSASFWRMNIRRPWRWCWLTSTPNAARWY